MKRCCKCGETKPFSEFWGCSSRADKYQPRCKVCHRSSLSASLKIRRKVDPLFVVHNSIKARCSYKKHKAYHRYGARGITVCEAWKSYKTFAEWCMENGFQKGLQIDRIDNDGNYEPSNCRFVTPEENSQNTSRTMLNREKVGLLRELRRQGVKYTEMAALYGVTPSTVRSAVIGETWSNVVDPPPVKE